MQTTKTIFFDLDGTLTDPKEGITKSIQYAFAQMGHVAPALEALTLMIGPPLHQYFAEVFGAGNVSVAIDHYRQRYDHENMCLAENSLYPGILPMLETLHRHGKRMFLVTAKPRIIAERIVRHFGLNAFFEGFYGSELDGTRGNKGELIAYILEREQLAAETILMVGDREHDVIGAAQNGIKSIGVTWGYGSRAELEAAGASSIACAPADLLSMIVKKKEYS